ncbi:MAG: hypothetical protein K0S08_316 [Gammaproteobacteria bacterium]|nr:hypothetical protein [Gammaproteobacteria bacterium]
MQWEKQQENLVIEISPDFFSYLQNFPEFMGLVYFPPRQSDKNFIEINEESVEDLEKLLAKQSIFTTKSPIFSPQL